MKKIAVIGLGSFGMNLVFELAKKNNEIIAIDSDPNKVNEVKDIVTQPITMDAANKENLLSTGITEVDCAVVSCGPNLESSILTVHILKELEIDCIIAKALSIDHEKILQLVGATQIIFPEKDVAKKVANQINSPNLMDYIPLQSGFVIEELAPPDLFIGKTLTDLRVRNKYNINVIAIKQIIPDKNSKYSNGSSNFGLTLNPSGDFVIKESDILIVLGSEDDITKLHERINK